MSKKPIPEGLGGQPVEKPVEQKPTEANSIKRMILVSNEPGGSYAIAEYELPAWVIEKHGVLKSKSNPDVAWIWGPQLVEKAREIVGI